MNPRTHRLARGLARAGLAAALGAALAACSSPPARFYTLNSEAVTARRSLPANPALLIQVPAVGVPEQVAKSQLVVQKNAAQVDVLEQERWSSPPADEIRRALSSALTQRLETIDVADSAYPPGVPVYRVSVNVQRFESWPGERAVIDAVWSVRSLTTQAVMTCRSNVAEPVQPGYDALVAGHRQALGVLAAQIAAGVRAMAGAAAA
uniref:PqiC family protein n=1 Tax=Burkholderia alba TaxID=2683677 RepID=UPI002B05587C